MPSKSLGLGLREAKTLQAALASHIPKLDKLVEAPSQCCAKILS